MVTLKWTIGDVEITPLVELEAGQLIQSIIKPATLERIRTISWLRPHFADDEGHLKAVVQGFLIRSKGLCILIDTCNGNDKTRTDVPEWGNLQTDFLAQLRATGLSEHDVNVVACTHLHMDHVGWNTSRKNGAWVPTFPNAQYLFAKEEYDYWVTKPPKEIADDKAAFDDSVTPIIEAGLACLVDRDHRIDGNVSFIPTPGHTPCHVSVLVQSRGKRAIISGDLLHHPCQIAELSWTTESDTIPDQAVASRRKILEEIADDDNTLLIGSHFANPTAGHVKRRGDGLVLEVGS